MIPQLPIELATEDYSIPCLVPESEIRAFIGGLKNRDTHTVLTRLFIVAFAAIELMESRLAGEPDETKLMLIKQIAREDKDKRYRHMMDEIVAVLGSTREGEHWTRGFGSVCMTIVRALEYASESLPNYEAIRSAYEQRLERVRQAGNP